MHKRAFANLLLIAAAWSAAPLVVRAQDASPIPATLPSTDVPQLRALLFDPASRSDQRDTAAQKLLARPSAEPLTAIHDALWDVQQPTVQLAAAKALAENPTADPSLIDPLFALLDPNNRPQLIDAAASALTAFKTQPNVVNRLLELSRTGLDEKVRLAAIRACGTFLDKRVAGTMIDLLDPAAQPASINDAAERSLAYMTGIRAEITELGQWRQWWQANQTKSEPDFIADLARSRAARYDLTQQQLADLQNEVSLVLRGQYDNLRSAPSQATELLLRYLRSSQPSIRAIGAQIAATAAQSGVTPVSVRDQLRQLVGDPSPNVRRQAALALRDINDADALEPLLVQLAQEKDPTVRAAIAQALAPIRDPRAIPLLITLLEDAHIPTVQDAAGALSDLELWARVAPDRKPALAEQAAAKLMSAVKTRTRSTENIDLRRNLILAMVPLESKTQAKELQILLDGPAEMPRVRQTLLRAVGALKDPNYAGSIVPWIDDQSDWGVRYQAVLALGQAADSFDYGQRLGKLLNPKNEPQPEVRDAAWTVLTKLFPTASPTELDQWRQQVLKDDPVRTVVVLIVLRDKAHQAGNVVEERQRNSQLGDTAREAAAQNEKDRDFTNTARHYEISIAAYRDALAAITQGNTLFVVEGLMDSLLRSGKYAEAIAFAQQQIRKDPSFRELLGKIRLEAERLSNNVPDYDRARSLIDQALKMDPPLTPTERVRLEEISTKLLNRSREQNFNPLLPEHPLNARAY